VHVSDVAEVSDLLVDLIAEEEAGLHVVGLQEALDFLLLVLVAVLEDDLEHPHVDDLVDEFCPLPLRVVELLLGSPLQQVPRFLELLGVDVELVAFVLGLDEVDLVEVLVADAEVLALLGAVGY
jgi:hypothetical protein